MFMRPCEDGKHLPKPTWVLLGPAMAHPHWQHADVPLTSVILQLIRLPNSSTLQPKLLVSQSQVSWSHTMQPINPSKSANEPSHLPRQKQHPNRPGKASEASGRLFWRCQRWEMIWRSGASPCPAVGPPYLCFFPPTSACICCGNNHVPTL